MAKLLSGSEIDDIVDKVLDDKDLGILLKEVNEPEDAEEKLKYVNEVIDNAMDSDIVGKFKDMDFKVRIGYSLFSDMIGLLKEYREVLMRKKEEKK